MLRPLRIEYAGAVYHATSRGNKKTPVFKADADRLNFLNTLQHFTKRYSWLCHAYCLMTTITMCLSRPLTVTFRSACGN